MTLRSVLFLIISSFPMMLAASDAKPSGPIGGVVRVYSDQFQGKPTASGELYDVSVFTGAHDSLPIGTMVRVANFDTGKMVDVRINDRKKADANLIHISRAAARRIGLSQNEAARGSILVIGTLQSPPLNTSPTLFQNNGKSPSFNPFKGLRRDPLLDAVNEPEKVAQVRKNEQTSPFDGVKEIFNKDRRNQYGIPGNQYAPPTMVQNQPNRKVAGPGEVIPLSAGKHSNPKKPSTTAPPYRVQFGAFRRSNNADELNRSLNQSGVNTTVVRSTANNLFLVVTSGAFPSADAAQGWINQEVVRRGWRERPVVIR